MHTIMAFALEQKPFFSTRARNTQLRPPALNSSNVLSYVHPANNQRGCTFVAQISRMHPIFTREILVALYNLARITV